MILQNSISDTYSERKTLDIERIKNFISKEDCIVCVDNVHGATRGRIQRILGESAKIKYIRTEDDFLFGGVAPSLHRKTCKALRGFCVIAMRDSEWVLS